FALARRGGVDELHVGDGFGEGRENAYPLDDRRAARRRRRSAAWPAFAGVDDAEVGQPEIRHRPGRRTDILAELRLDQNDGGAARLTAALTETHRPELAMPPRRVKLLTMAGWARLHERPERLRRPDLAPFGRGIAAAAGRIFRS